jgi:hypothetical protein
MNIGAADPRESDVTVTLDSGSHINGHAQRPGRASRASVRWSVMLGSVKSLYDLVRP